MDPGEDDVAAGFSVKAGFAEGDIDWVVGLTLGSELDVFDSWFAEGVDEGVNPGVVEGVGSAVG